MEATSPTESMEPSEPVACSLDQAGLAERGQRWRSLADRALTGVAGTRDGLRLSFGATPGVEAELRDLAELERDCCAFASWTVRATGETVVLDVRGTSPEAVAAVREMFTDLPRFLDRGLPCALSATGIRDHGQWVITARSACAGMVRRPPRADKHWCPVAA